VVWCLCEGAVNVVSKNCEDCQLKRKTFGLPGERRRRWCSVCAKLHAGAVSAHKKCEGCGLKTASFGLLEEGRKRRWCSACARGHEGAENLDEVAHKKCEGCGSKFERRGRLPPGLPHEVVWCAGCAPESGSPPQKKPKATGPPLTTAGHPFERLSHPFEVLISPRWLWGIPMEN
jgi:hypothetical protein